MDSGIDSTESSNGSAPEEAEGVGVMDGPPPLVMDSVDKMSDNNDKGASTPSPASLSSSSSSASPSSLAPSTLKALAASTISEMQTDTPPNTPVHIHKSGGSTFQIPPEGSRLQLHFPSSSIGRPDSNNTFELDPLPGLSFANVSPSMCLSRGYEIYSQGYQVLPYEQNDLKRKRRALLGLRHKHYKKLCALTKQRRLRIAVGLNNVSCVEQLLKEGADPKQSDIKQRTLLHIAASKGYADIARLLLQHGADPNQKDAVGNTALHLAACTSNIPMVTLLLKAGTNVRQEDNQGYSPLHIARSKLKLLQRDNYSDSHDIKKQVFQVIEMMQTYLACSGSSQEAELLHSFTTQLSLSDSRQDVQALLDSLNSLSLNNSTTTTTTTTT